MILEPHPGDTNRDGTLRNLLAFLLCIGVLAGIMLVLITVQFAGDSIRCWTSDSPCHDLPNWHRCLVGKIEC